MVFIGTAGWGIPAPIADEFPGSGSHLDRYARVFGCTEVNSSFKRDHLPSTYARWAAATPAGFRFAVKLPHQISHRCRLEGVGEPLDRFLAGVRELGERLGPLLLQLPPSLALDARVANTFFAVLRHRYEGPVVCEPRHADWFGPRAELVFARHRIARVAADPPTVSGAGQPGGWLGDRVDGGVTYVRLHGAPVVYRSSYTSARIAQWADDVHRWSAIRDGWCVFDNTASGAAAANALEFSRRMSRAFG